MGNYLFYTNYLIIKNTTALSPTVLNYIISLFHQVEQFHWVGWYTMFLAFLCAFLLFCLFHGESSFHCRQRFQTCKTTWIEMKCTKLWFIVS